MTFDGFVRDMDGGHAQNEQLAGDRGQLEARLERYRSLFEPATPSRRWPAT